MRERGVGERAWATARLAGVAGLAYVAAAAVENAGILDEPGLSSSAEEIGRAYEDQAFEIVTAAAGAAALIAYATFALALFTHLRHQGAGGSWPAVGLAGGIAAVLIAGAALVVEVVLIFGVAGDLSESAVLDLYEIAVRARLASAVFVALLLAGYGLAALRSAALPRPLALAACALAAAIALTSPAALAASEWPRAAAGVGFGLQALWILLAGLWLALADGTGGIAFVRRATFCVLAIAAGVIGLGLIAAPGASGRFFAWGLGPEPLAAFAGAAYLGSAITYLAFLTRPEREVRGLVAAAALLSVSVLAITVGHLDEFDFERLQAWAWIVLFAAFSILTVALLAVSRGGQAAEAQRWLVPGARVVAGAVSVLLAALAVALWIDPVALSGASPFELTPLGGRFAGSWVGLLALLCGVAAVDGRAEVARASAFALVALPAAALVAAARTITDLEPTGAAIAYVTVLAALAATGVGVLILARPKADAERPR